MKPKSELSLALYELMLERGYPEPFCDLVTKNLNTDFTAGRMIGFFRYYKKPSPEMVADEMLAILSDRGRIMKKKDVESTNAKWNEFLRNGFGDEDDEDY